MKNVNEAATKISFQVACLLASKESRLFARGKLIELCLTADAEEMCPEKIK